MADVGPICAEDRARQAVGFGPTERGTVSRVERLDHPGRAYYLVVFGTEALASAVVAVDASSGAAMTSAVVGRAGPHLSVASAQAMNAAGIEGPLSARLVWKPCRASLSPLLPFWEVSGPSQAVFIDQQAKRWLTLPSAQG